MPFDDLKNRSSRRYSGRFRLIAGILSIAVWVGAYSFYHKEKQQRFEETAQQASRIAVFFERNVIGIFQYGDAYLKLVRREYLRDFDLNAVRELMAEVPLNNSIASHVTIMNELGEPLLISGYPIKPGTSAKDREYFKFQENSAGDELLISRPSKGRNSDKVIVRMVRRFNRPNGEFGGVIFVALETDHITEFFNAMKIGPKSSATLVGNDQFIRARSSYGPLGPGQNISGSRIWQELEHSPTGLYRQISVVDDITRFYAYRRVPGFPLIVAIGISVDDLAGPPGLLQVYDYAVPLLATLLIFMTAFFLQRQQKLLGEIQSQNTELENQNVELEQFAYTVSHDLKAPLVTITGFLGLLQKDLAGEDQEAITRDLEQIKNAADKMAQLLDDLLELSRIGRLIGAVESRGLSELVKEACTQFPIQFELQGVELDIDENMPEVECDASRIIEVYQNLIQNALKFMGDQPSPQLQIGAIPADGELRCFVRDNGIGIAPEYQQRIFDLFDRLDSHVEGTGIGLALVRRIIEVHGGRIWVESQGQGKGSCFWFTLPLKK